MSNYFRQHIMENKIIYNYLTKAGLNDKEIKVYLYCLTNGPTHASIIGKNCNISRTNVYDVTKKLEEKGLCYNMGSEYGKKIKANPPSHIKELLEVKEKEIASLKNNLEEVIREIKKFDNFKPIGAPKVSYFEGKESIKKLFSAILQSEEKVVKIAGSELEMIEVMGVDYMIDFNERRAKKNIKLEALRPGIKRGSHDVFRDDKKYLREIRIRPEKEIRLKSQIIIWGDHVAFCSFNGDSYATQIEDKQMSLMQKSWFDYIWNKSDKL